MFMQMLALSCRWNICKLWIWKVRKAVVVKKFLDQVQFMHMHVMWDEILDTPQLDNYDNTQTEF